MIGRVLGGYALTKEIGAGGMGKVYLAEHRRLGRRAAVKVLLPELCGDPEITTRFFNEARATSLLKHPAIVEIYNCGVLDGQAFIVMELLDGETLDAALGRAGHLANELDTVGAVLAQVAGALTAAHETGIVHRDLTPGNVFLLAPRPGAAGALALSVKILDFGVAKLATDWRGLGVRTNPGDILGTPTYMAPEQCMGASAVDTRADIYSLGCIAFQMLTGRPPYLRSSATEMIVAHLREPTPLVSSTRPEVPRAVDQLVARMMAKAPEARPPTMRDVVTELAAALGTSAGRLASLAPSTSKLLGGETTAGPAQPTPARPVFPRG